MTAGPPTGRCSALSSRRRRIRLTSPSPATAAAPGAPHQAPHPSCRYRPPAETTARAYSSVCNGRGQARLELTHAGTARSSYPGQGCGPTRPARSPSFSFSRLARTARRCRGPGRRRWRTPGRGPAAAGLDGERPLTALHRIGGRQRLLPPPRPGRSAGSTPRWSILTPLGKYAIALRSQPLASGRGRPGRAARDRAFRLATRRSALRSGRPSARPRRRAPAPPPSIASQRRRLVKAWQLSPSAAGRRDPPAAQCFT